jgi:FkbM family methyltransferase
LFIAEIWHHFVQRPLRRRAYARQRVPYVHATDDGLKFKLHPDQAIDHFIAVDGVFERKYLRFLKTLLHPDAVMVDAGANIGNHAIFLHRHCKAIHCFEPNPLAADRLEENIALNHADNIVVHRVGLGDHDDTLPFAVNKTGNLGMSGFFDVSSRPGDYDMVHLPIRQADNALDELALERLDLLKVDVEGFELALFQGLQRTLKQFRPVVAFEYHGHLMPDGSFDDFRAALSGYVFAEPAFGPATFTKLQRLRYHLKHSDRMTLYDVPEPEPRTYEILLAVPAEHDSAKAIVQ